MTVLQLIYAPNPIFKQQAEKVEKFDAQTKQIVDDMFATLEYEHAIGLGANMVGILKRIIVIDTERTGISNRFYMINPEIIEKSSTTQTFEEASLCFPGIAAEVTRPDAITVKYYDCDGIEHSMKADGFLATVIQHEMDYLDGVVFLDYLSKMKKDMLLKKMQKLLKQHPPHIHGKHCSH